MIDHVLGRPSTQFRKIQVFAVVSFWVLYLLRGNNHGPPGVRLLSSRLYRRMTPWQATVMTLLWLYVSRNFAKVFGLESPEPLANLYSRSYFRATWITTALDAGFWTAMNIKTKWLRDLASVVFSAYYLIAAEQADEKVHRVRATLTVDHLRVSWNKATTPYLSFISTLLRPRLCKYPPVALRIPRPRESSYKEPVNAWLYFNGPLSALPDQTNILLDIPGGGFVAMCPRTSDDKLLALAAKTGVPVLSLDYKKAPEHPYPYALNECYDVYHTIVSSRGRCIGLSGMTCPKVVITGDSAGGNLATGLTLMILQSGTADSSHWQSQESLPAPAGLVLLYPSLDMNIGGWMTEEQMSLIRDRGMRKTNQNILRRKSEDYYKLTPATPCQSSDCMPVVREYFNQQHEGVLSVPQSPTSGHSHHIDKPVPGNVAEQVITVADEHPTQIQTRLAVSSMISYFNDRILTPEMMRAMIILYIGPYNRPDFSTDFLLSPLLAPDSLLARFPKTYLLTGERDPLVDDTVIFAGRIRQAKLHRFRERQELGLEKSTREFDEKAHVEVTLVPGISHGFLQFVSVFPEGWRQIFRCSRWIKGLFASAEQAEQAMKSAPSLQSRRRATPRATSRALVSSVGSIHGGMDMSNGSISRSRYHKRGLTGESSADEDRPLEMSILGMSKRSSSPSSLSKAEDPSPGGATESPISPNIPANHPLPEGAPKKPIFASSLKTFHPSRPSPRPPAGARPSGQKNLNNGVSDGETTDEDDGITHDWKERLRIHREKSFSSLPSEEDLLGRRMKGLAGGLMGIGEGARTP
ncbi:hypothetical protein AJ80_02438 [Polytolypa hystricis UAMH7299]|uniref:Alpha/beta hydrolase fold-3 domain-containing protein n=1 Tax=Polytolypa hystricis (strain UAMH7299) TaxID=1447883 RepID=A0A2B7YHC7_POLH7|nr:hypothetical protein AJ80_02438 [Polytolypa hystricis UAMH7299]